MNRVAIVNTLIENTRLEAPSRVPLPSFHLALDFCLMLTFYTPFSLSLFSPLLSSPLARPQNTYRAHKIISKLKNTNMILSVSCFTNKSDLHWLSCTDSAVRSQGVRASRCR